MVEKCVLHKNSNASFTIMHTLFLENIYKKIHEKILYNADDTFACHEQFCMQFQQVYFLHCAMRVKIYKLSCSVCGSLFYKEPEKGNLMCTKKPIRAVDNCSLFQVNVRRCYWSTKRLTPEFLVFSRLKNTKTTKTHEGIFGVQIWVIS